MHTDEESDRGRVDWDDPETLDVDFYEAAAPTRYRAFRRVERRVLWHPRYEPRPTYPSPSELEAGDWVAWDDEIRLGPHWFDFPPEVLERFSPDIYRNELTPEARQDESPRDLTTRDRYGEPTAFYAPRLADPEPEPDVIPWDELPPEERERLRLTEYELPWPLYGVVVPYVPAPELTHAQEATAALMAEPPGGENRGRVRVDGESQELGPEGIDRQDFLNGGGWVKEIPPATGVRPGRRPVDVDALRAGLVGLVGEVEDVQRLTPPGRPSAGIRAERLELARRVAYVLRHGAGSRDGERVVAALATIYERSPRTFYRLAELGGWKLSQ